MSLLAGIPQAALDELARQCRWRRFIAGESVVSRDAADNDLYLIVSGKVRVTAFSAAGREVSYGEMGAGQWFGDFAAIDGRPRSADVVALEDTLVAVVSPASFRRLIHDHPAVCDRMLLRLVNAVRELTERIFEFSTLGVQNRLHAELLRLARQSGVDGNSARIDPAPRHAALAASISTYREQVTRELSVMARQGLVQRAGRALVIPNVERLEQIVSSMRRSA